MSNALAIRHTAEDSQARVNAASNAQVKRYWPGRAPDWYDGQQGPEAEASESSGDEREPEPEEEPAATSVAAPVIVKKASIATNALMLRGAEYSLLLHPLVLPQKQHALFAAYCRCELTLMVHQNLSANCPDPTGPGLCCLYLPFTHVGSHRPQPFQVHASLKAR